MLNFDNQVVVVTGGTRGIGAELTRSFLKQGATVFATFASNEEAARLFVESLEPSEQEKVHTERFDVKNENEIESFFENLDGKVEGIDVLINNSGIRRDGLVAAMKEGDWDAVLQTNLKGSFLMSKHAVMRMMKKRYGRIINMSSIGGILGLSGQANYAASKAGQIAMSKSLSKEVAKRGITVNNICPGFIETELIKDLPEDLVKEYKKQVPMKRFGSTTEVAAAVLFLASREASYITGTSLEIAGGL